MDKLGPSHQFTWNSQGRWIDLSSQMAFDAKCLSEMAKLINLKEESEHYRKKHNKLAEIINDLCWNEEHQFYFDLGYGEQIIRYHIELLDFISRNSSKVPTRRICFSSFGY